ncbi:MAG: hypothetical protein JKX76_01325 [Colwellia sp.]|nr:hypothetical protein [Colwellia sp.]
MNIENSTITLTFGDVAENHVGNQQLGTLSDEGLSYEDLTNAQGEFERRGYETELIHLNPGLRGTIYANLTVEDAYVLVIRNGIEWFMGDCVLEPDQGTVNESLFQEQSILNHDKKAKMYGRVVNKHARWNLCFADYSQESDYEIGNGTVVAFGDVPLTSTIRENLPNAFGEKAANLYCEGNYYYNNEKTGIGMHGDNERRIVIAARIGASMPLKYQWFYKCKGVGEPIEINLNGGDMYAMSAKAVGTDFKKRNMLTLRHAAGCKKYTTLKKTQI